MGFEPRSPLAASPPTSTTPCPITSRRRPTGHTGRTGQSSRPAHHFRPPSRRLADSHPALLRRTSGRRNLRRGGRLTSPPTGGPRWLTLALSSTKRPLSKARSEEHTSELQSLRH